MDSGRTWAKYKPSATNSETSMTDKTSESFGYVVAGEERRLNDDVSVVDPATNDEIATVPEAGPEGVDEAIESAVAVQQEWAAYDTVERGRILDAVAERIRDEAERIAELETCEEGRPVTESRYMIDGASHYFEYYAGLTDKMERRQIPVPGDGSYIDYTMREPYGVFAQIVPWNASFVLAARGLGPTLAAGNTIVAKAPSNAPASLVELAKLAHEAGLPTGVLNIVTGSGSSTGETLVTDDRIDAVEFTGSTETGKGVMRSAAERVSHVHLELGGKGVNIVFADVDLEAAVESLVATFQNAGQICYAPTRVFVQSSVYDEFVERAVERVEAMEVGPGIEDPDMGPLISASARENAVEFVEDAREHGARVLTGGEVPNRAGELLRADARRPRGRRRTHLLRGGVRAGTHPLRVPVERGGH